MSRMPSVPSVQVMTPDEFDGKLFAEHIVAEAVASEASIREELDRYYEKHPEALVEHLRKKARATGKFAGHLVQRFSQVG